MRPSLDFPSSPSSAWSCTGSRSPCSPVQDQLSPTTPDSCFPPAPTIVSPDEFSLQIDLQLGKVADESSHKPSVAHLMPQALVPSPMADPCLLSEDDMTNLRVFMRNAGCWENMHDCFESSPPRRPHCNAPRIPPASQDGTSDDFSWEATHSALADPNDPLDTSRYSLLIREVSLLVGLAAEDDHLSGDRCPPVPDGSTQVSDILPLSLAPTRSLASRKRRNASLPRPTPPSGNAHIDNHNPNLSLQSEKPPPVASRDSVTPIARHKSVEAVRPSISARRRQGQVFDVEPSLSNASCRNAVHLDETFLHPREPPPKPAPNSPTNRCSSLDRLECSLRKLEAYAPSNHRKSQSEGQPPDHVAHRKDKRPSLPPPRRLKKQQSTQEITDRNPSRPAHGYHSSVPLPPASRPQPPHQLIIPQTCPVVTLDDEHHKGDVTPSSFMDMDITQGEEASQKRQASVRRPTSKQKMRGLVNAAKRVSRGVIAWGKNLTGSTRPLVVGQETTAV